MSKRRRAAPSLENSNSPNKLLCRKSKIFSPMLRCWKRNSFVFCLHDINSCLFTCTQIRATAASRQTSRWMVQEKASSTPFNRAIPFSLQSFPIQCSPLLIKLSIACSSEDISDGDGNWALTRNNHLWFSFELSCLILCRVNYNFSFPTISTKYQIALGTMTFGWLHGQPPSTKNALSQFSWSNLPLCECAQSIRNE